MEVPTVPAAFANTCPSHVSGFPALLFTHLIQSLITANCKIGSADQYPVCYSDRLQDGESFDFIIVGAGTAGSALAHRLSENKNWNILLIEAGGDPNYISDIPSFLFNTQFTEIDWKYFGTPSETACQGMIDRKCYFPRGKVLGGCSTINAMLNVRGNAADYDGWRDLGNPGWSYEEILPYIKKTENFGVEDAYHSDKGPQHMNNFPRIDKLELVKDLIISSFAELGYPPNEDISGKTQIGCGRAKGTILNGFRMNAAKAYLVPIKDRSNLKVLKNSIVEKVLFEGDKAIGVRLNNKGGTYSIKASKEVILSAGTIGSPHLLLLSGVGQSKELSKLDIPVVADLPGVGQNLQDHLIYPGVPLVINKNTAEAAPLEVLLNEYYKLLTNETSLFSTIGITDLVAFVNTETLSSSVPNLQFHVLLVQKGNLFVLQAIMKSNNYVPEIVSQMEALVEESDVLIFFPTLLRPKSRGQVLLKSRNHNEHPIINHNYLSEQDDVDTIIKGVEIVKKLMKTKSLQLFTPEIRYLDLPKCKKHKVASNEFNECHIRHLASSIYHPVGTCKMGPTSDKQAVVDSRLRVYSVKNLRIADASIMPEIVRGNTNTATLMIGEKAAAMIQEDWNAHYEHNEL